MLVSACGANSSYSWESAGVALRGAGEPNVFGGEVAMEGGAASRALERAKDKKQALNGQRGDELVQLRLAAVDAYRHVHERWPRSGVVASEAAFRAGELLRSAGEPDAALGQFEIAVGVADGGEFTSRALYEIGHVQRREGRMGLALEAFEELASSAIADDHLRDLASIWYAKVLAETGQMADAERVLKRASKTAKDPVDRIRAFDELILLIVERGDLEGASGWLRDCKLSVAEQSLELTTEGGRVLRALENMRGLKALQLAIAVRMKRADYDPLR